jgi:predicted ATPase/predicted negative regulator of RcsB-dependent stress response
MRVGLLGELEVHDDAGRAVPITGAKLRALLAVLALQAGRPVPTDQLVDALWGDDPPPAVRNGLQGLTSKLRRSLGSSEMVTMRGGGYALELPPEAGDVHRYEQLVAEARAAASGGEVATALALLSEAESLWRGEPLSDFTYEDFASLAIGRLSELRLSAVEERLELDLAAGRHLAAIGELEVLVRAHPLRERPRALLMLALYRAGRQADALQVFQDARRQLADELGLDPGPELRQLESAILAQDPSLDAPQRPVVPAPAPAPSPRLTIPAPLTALVGRDEELEELHRCLAEHRLLTLVGPGGVGKTRLAVEVARAASATLEDGGVLVELAAVGEPAGVPAAISTALGLQNPTRLAELIGERELLVLLDNCEHVITAAATVAEELLSRCPNLRLLATSREGLRVPGEILWPVPPLRPDDATELFEARVRAAGTRVELTEETRQLIADICERLDGLPLAIELAAARTRAFPVQQLASRLHDRFRLLTGGSRTALPRQQTLRAVVDWSYELLFDDEQRVFERLSVFPGGCDLATAELVCAGDDLPVDDIADLIQALVDKSLVIAVSDGESLRFTQLQTLVQYGREKLAERGDARRVRDAMAAHFARLCAKSADAYIGDDQRSWLRSIDAERDNLRAALEWAIATDDADTALTIAGGASWPHWLAGTSVEGKRWLDAAFACAGPASPMSRALALTGRGLLDVQAGVRTDVDADLEEALALFEQAATGAPRSYDLPGLALASSFYAEIAVVRGEVAEARRRREQHLELCARLPDGAFAAAVVAYSRAKLAVLDGDLDAGEQHYREATAHFRTIDRPMMLSLCEAIVADFDERLGDFAAAAKELEAAITTNATLGMRGFNSSVQARLGWVFLQLGDLPRARQRYEDAVHTARWLGHRPVLMVALAGSAVLLREAGRAEEAGAAAREALELHLSGIPLRFENRIEPSAHHHPAVVSCCAVLAGLAADAGDPRRAARLLGHAERHRTLNPATLPPLVVELLAAAQDGARIALGDDELAEAMAAGAAGDLRSEVSASA